MGRNPGGKRNVSNRQIAVTRGKRQKASKTGGALLQAGKQFFISQRVVQGADRLVAENIWDSMSQSERTGFCTRNSGKIAVDAKKKAWKAKRDSQLTEYKPGFGRY
jgi:hypothetical protein